MPAEGPPDHPQPPEADRLRTEAQSLKAESDELRALGAREGPADPRRLHLFQIQWVRDVLVILLLLGVLYLGYLLRALTVPVLLALALAYLVEPVVRRVVARGWMNRPVAAASVIVCVVLIVAIPLTTGITLATVQGVGYGRHVRQSVSLLRASVADPENQELTERVVEQGRIWGYLRDVIVKASQTPPAAPEAGAEDQGAAARPRSPPESPQNDDGVMAADLVRERQGNRDQDAVGPLTPDRPEADRPLLEQLVAWADDLLQRSALLIGETVGRRALGTGAGALRLIAAIVGSLVYLAFAIFLILFFFFFFCTGWARVTNSLSELIPSWKRTRTLSLLRQMDAVIAGFVRGRVTIMLILTGMFILGYWIIGVPAPLLVGAIVGVLSLVPYLSLVGIPLSIILMWMQPAGGPEFQQAWWWIILAPTILYFIIQATDDYLWTPLIQGKTTDMDVPSILFAVLAGGILAGFYGVLIAIPAAACIKILLRESFWPRFKAWAEGRVKDFLPISRYDPTETTPPAAPKHAERPPGQ